MNKIEKTVVALLFACLIGWGLYQSKMAPKPVPQTGAGVEAPVDGSSTPGDAAITSGGSREVPPDGQETTSDNVDSSPVLVNRAPETFVTLESDDVTLRLSSYGGGVVDAQISSFLETREPDSGPVHLDFSSRPALVYRGLKGVDIDAEFEMTTDGTEAVLTASGANGLTLTRRITLVEHYHFRVEDTFSNSGSNAMQVAGHSIAIGPMRMLASSSKVPGYSYLGFDTLASGKKGKVTHWSNKINTIFGAKKSSGCSQPSGFGLPSSASKSLDEPLDWMAAKNKYFAQILAPEGGAVDATMYAYRDMSSTNTLVVDAVAGDLEFGAVALAGGASVTRSYSYYVGPKKDKLLDTLDNRQRQVMQFGWWGWYRSMCRGLLWTLNIIHVAVPNYGLAVILLTVLVRLIFWPILQKSTEHMRRMQKVQPLMTEIREKHKNDPQKMNQAMMQLYKEKKVNPMAGCLPMLIQIPVFFALFTVLRSAVELRFAGFLWVGDLSEPEGLFADVLPIPLNILPLLMTATTVIQQKMTPTMGDPMQRKMMMWMPVIFLFMLYSMPSALVLYWTTSQGLAILQMQMQKAKEKKSGEPEVIEVPKKKAPPPVGWEKNKQRERKRKKKR